MADEAKAKGNKAFSAGQYEEAITHFSDAIALAPENHVLYSNRSAAYASLQKYEKALEDAEQTVKLQPSWAKGYSRLGAAHSGLQNFKEAIEAYDKGLELDPSNEALKTGKADVEKAQAQEESAGGMGMLGKAFTSPDLFAKLHNDPRSRAALLQPDFRAMLQEVQKNPSNLNRYLNDPRMMQALGVLLGINIQTADPDSMAKGSMFDDEADKPFPSTTARASTNGAPSDAPKKAEPEEPPEEMLTEEVEKRKKKEAAIKEKELGNAAYKKKEFDTAIEHYTKAIELDDTDISFITNRAAVYFEMGKHDECIADCDRAVERGHEVHADYKMVAKAYTRKGTAFVKIAKTSQDYDLAIQAFNKALTEHRNPDTLKKLNEAEKAKKELEQQEYYNPELAEEEREKGNEFFKKHLYPDAVKCYSEAIRRNPKDVKAYSNRAASYTKLTALPEALKDANKCIELDPTFIKGYVRKGAAQFFMKEYDKAMEAYREGLKLDPNNQELLDGIGSCISQIRKAGNGELSPEDLKERQMRAMQDPEIQAILTDPIMRQVLTDFQEDPKAAAAHQRNPMIMAKISKLAAAGIVQLR
eukprot:TRINITY_DN38347_c0_g1_i1.p1 TRINITY_DN38347_c0_g1~~TRINITY_DN38347_c0_g1_i1.p1  ORF type:complete len:586 (+),score=186.26 TRINITY_DN38347_c0_g1_i1:283-2040(+)